jgi:hypothetical protein
VAAVDYNGRDIDAVANQAARTAAFHGEDIWLAVRFCHCDGALSINLTCLSYWFGCDRLSSAHARVPMS